MTAASDTTVSSYSPSWQPNLKDIIRGEMSGTVPYATNAASKRVEELKGKVSNYTLSEIDKKKGRKEPSKAKKELKSRILELRMPDLEEKLLAEPRAALSLSCGLIYERALKGTLPFILGGADLRSDLSEAISIIINFGILSGETNGANAYIRKSTTDLETGSVLCDGSWSVFKNDCALLGIIHSGRSCLVARIKKKPSTDPSEPAPSDLSEHLWDPVLKRPRVLGREILMLNAAGYIQAASEEQIKSYGHKFVPKDKDAVKKVTLSRLLKAAEAPPLSLKKITDIMAPYSKKSTLSLIPLSEITNAAGAASGAASGGAGTEDGF